MKMRHCNSVAVEKSSMTLAPENLFPEDTGIMHQRNFTQNLLYIESTLLKN